MCREGADAIEAAHGEVVGFLGTAAEHHVLHTIADKQSTQPYGMGTTGAGRADGHVDAFEVENGREIHRHRGVHRLEDGR